MSGNSAEPGRTVASKTVAILKALSAGRGYTLSNLALQTRLPVSTAYRLLHDLAASPVVEQAPNGEYRPGPGLRVLAAVTIQPTLFTRAPLVVDDLAEALQMTVRLGVICGTEIAYIEKSPGARPGTSFPNPARLPLHATALGKILLAFAPAVLSQLVAVRLPRFTPHTLTTVDELRHTLCSARARRFAMSYRELDPVVCAVAVPVLDDSGGAIAAIEVHVPDFDVRTLADVVPALSVAARALSRELRCPPEGSRSSCVGLGYAPGLSNSPLRPPPSTSTSDAMPSPRSAR